MNKLSQFWQELKRRKVVRVVSVYAAAAFVILELVDIITEPLRLPEWTLQFAIVFLCIGFIIAVIFSWIYDVKPEGGLEKTQPVDKVKEEGIPKSSNSWKIASYISFVVIVALMVLNIIPRSDRSDIKEILDKSIAVLPFINDSPDEENAYFINGTMEAIIDNLCKISDLRVVGRTSVEQYRNAPKPIPVIAEEMNVSYILGGSGQKYGNKVRLTLQLLDARNDEHIWSSPFSREIVIEDIFELQSEIAQLVAAEIEAIITPEEKQLIEKIPTTSLTAYDFYQQGIDEEDLDRAEELFLRALEYDSAYALAYIGMATNHFMSTFGNAPPNEAWPKVKEYTRKALELDSTQAEAYALLGRINTNYDWDWKAAERNFKKALQLNPNSARIHMYYSILLTYTERNEEAIVEAKQAQELDPLSKWISHMVAIAYLWDHQYDRAIEELQMVLAMDPNYWQAHSQLGNAYLAKLMSEEAIAEYEKVIDLSGGGNGDMAFLAITYYEIGEKAKAEQLFDNLMQRSRDEYVPPMFFYLIHKARGELDLAYEWLEQALNEHDSYLPWIRVHPIERYRIPDEPRFNELLKKMGLEKYQE